MAIYRVSGWDHLCQIIAQLIEKVHAFRSHYPFRLQDFHAFNRDHEQILGAIARRDAEGVAELIVMNVRRGLETMKAVHTEEGRQP